MEQTRNTMEMALMGASKATSMPALKQTIEVMAKHQAPTHTAILEAVKIGDAGIMTALLSSPKLSGQERMQFATDALLSWCESPLSIGQPETLFKVLVEKGADLSVRAPRMATIAERVAERLGRIEGNERRMKVAGKLKFNTAPFKILNQCWDAMVASGADMIDAQRVRVQAGRLVVSPVVQTKHQKPASEAAADFDEDAVSGGRLRMGLMR